MVRGLEKFCEYFKEHNEHYVIIGGTAAYLIGESVGIESRPTKDIDIIVLTKSDDNGFLTQLKQFFNDGEYENRSSGVNKQFYRFDKPKNELFPYQIELLASSSLFDDVSTITNSLEVSSLEAINMDIVLDDIVLKHSTISNGVCHINSIGLVLLKMNAFTNINRDYPERKSDLAKHYQDIDMFLEAIALNELIDSQIINDFINCLDKEDEIILKVKRVLKLNE